MWVVSSVIILVDNREQLQRPVLLSTWSGAVPVFLVHSSKCPTPEDLRPSQAHLCSSSTAVMGVSVCLSAHWFKTHSRGRNVSGTATSLNTHRWESYRFSWVGDTYYCCLCRPTQHQTSFKISVFKPIDKWCSQPLSKKPLCGKLMMAEDGGNKRWFKAQS